MTSNLSNVCIPPRTIKQESQDDPNINIYETSIEHTSWQSSVQEFGTNVEMEATDLVAVIIEPNVQIETIAQSTIFSNYMKNVFICKVCNANFENVEEFIVHKNISHTNTPYVCEVCYAKFPLRAHLNLHFAEHDDNLCIRNSSEIQSSSKRTLTINPQNISNKEKTIFYCSYCNKYFKSKQSLGQHNRHHHSIIRTTSRKSKTKTVKCNWCTLEITKCNLLRHIRTLHPLVGPKKCPYCTMSFKFAPLLKLHLSECHKL